MLASMFETFLDSTYRWRLRAVNENGKTLMTSYDNYATEEEGKAALAVVIALAIKSDKPKK